MKLQLEAITTTSVCRFWCESSATRTSTLSHTHRPVSTFRRLLYSTQAVSPSLGEGARTQAKYWSRRLCNAQGQCNKIHCCSGADNVQPRRPVAGKSRNGLQKNLTSGSRSRTPALAVNAQKRISLLRWFIKLGNSSGIFFQFLGWLGAVRGGCFCTQAVQ